MSTTAYLQTLRAAVFFSLGAALAGCSSSADQGFMIFAEPGKYRYYNCDQLIDAARVVGNRQKELVLLIDAAAQSAVGTALSVVAYRGESRMLTEELAMIETTARAKNCLTAANWRSNAVIR